MESIFNQLLQYCKKESIKANSGASAEEIIKLEQFLNFSLPFDFKQYLLKMDGFIDFEWDNDLISFWSINRIRKSHTDYPSELIVVADYSIECSSYGFFKNDQRVYITYDSADYKPKPVANTFREFVEMYLCDKASIFID